MIILKTKIVLLELSVTDMEIFMAISKVISGRKTGARWVRETLNKGYLGSFCHIRTR